MFARRRYSIERWKMCRPVLRPSAFGFWASRQRYNSDEPLNCGGRCSRAPMWTRQGWPNHKIWSRLMFSCMTVLAEFDTIRPQKIPHPPRHPHLFLLHPHRQPGMARVPISWLTSVCTCYHEGVHPQVGVAPLWWHAPGDPRCILQRREQLARAYRIRRQGRAWCLA